MTRYEVKTKKGNYFSGCEANIGDAQAYIQSLEKEGVEFEYVHYFDNEKRVKDIQEGKV